MIANTSLYDNTNNPDKFREVFGKRYIRRRIESPFDYITVASKGLKPAIISNFRAYFGLSHATTADLLSISEPTLYRWLNSENPIERNYSVKLFEIAELFLIGIELFGSKEYFFNWLNLPNTAIAGMKPIDLVDVPEGVSKVRAILGRIEHGVFS